jgi:hypothetical protein
MKMPGIRRNSNAPRRRDHLSRPDRQTRPAADLLRIECRKCGRAGRYRLADLLMRYGRNEKLFAFTDEVTANCTRKQARRDDPCGAIFPDLPTVL